MTATYTNSASIETRIVHIPAYGASLTGELVMPPNPKGLVIFAHGSGRSSVRNRRIAAALQHGGFGTLLFDLMTPEEELIDAVTRHLRFDVGFLARRLIDTIDFTSQQPKAALPLGLFGVSSGAAAALVASVARHERIAAVVARGGRPDLAAAVLPRITAPTLLVVGGNDTDSIPLNETAFRRMTCHKELVLVDGATHRFDEPGALDEVARLTVGWFTRYLAPVPAEPEPVDEIC